MPNKARDLFLVLISLVALVPGARAGDSDTAEDRRKYLESISAAEKDELRRRQERFEKLSVAEQEKLRQLEETLANDPQGKRLRDVMFQYHEWLSKLPSSQRIEIMIAPPEERVAIVKKRLQEQEKQRQEYLAMQSINRDDSHVIRNWMKSIFKRAEPDLLAHLPADRRQEYARLDEVRRFGFVVGAVIRKQRFENNPVPLDAIMKITEEDRKDLVGQLSENAQATYARATNDAERRQLMQSWMRTAVFPEIMWISPQEVKRFADRPNPKLPDHLRDQIDYLPPNQVRAEFEGVFREESRKRFGEGPGFPRPPFKGPPPQPPRD
jgi:hypothetical protein